ncbi:hypothetical protein [Nocardia sp. CA-120079]|uniref:hypothetical protein n=1 Tax=Nocardia sp. CA-120079 TaxID=3239974 RepID=UPI003D999F1C
MVVTEGAAGLGAGCSTAMIESAGPLVFVQGVPEPVTGAPAAYPGQPEHRVAVTG